MAKNKCFEGHIEQLRVAIVGTSNPGGINSSTEALRKLLDSASVRTTRIDSNCNGSALERIGIAVTCAVKIALCCQKKTIDVIHCQMSMSGSVWRKLFYAVIARGFGVPVVLHLHGSQFETFYRRSPSLFRKLISWNFNAANAVIVLSKSWATFVAGIAPLARIYIVPNSTSTVPAEFCRDRKCNRQCILFLGLVGPRKGFFDLLAAFRLVIDQGHDCTLIVAGNGDLDDARVKARDLCLSDRVIFLGWVGPEERERLLQSACILALPSYFEGLPMSLLEAMAHGVPVVTTAVGGIPELIQHQANGMLSEPGDIDKICSNITELLGDELFAASVGAAGRSTVIEGYSPNAVLPQLLEVYYSIIVRAPQLES